MKLESFLGYNFSIGSTVRPLVLVAFFGIVLVGGTNFVAVRFSNQELNPFWGAGLRFGIASLILFATVCFQHLTLPKGRSLLEAIL